MDELFGGPTDTNVTIGSGMTPTTMRNNYTMNNVFGIETVKRTLLKNVMGGGLGVEYSYSRTPSMIGSTINTIILYFKNHSNKPISNIKMGKLNLPEGMTLQGFEPIETMLPGDTFESQLSIKFPSVTHPAKFEIVHDNGVFSVTLSPSIGDLVRASALSPSEFADFESKLYLL